MAFSKRYMCLAVVALLPLAFRGSTGAGSGEGGATSHMVFVNVSGSDTAPSPDFDGDGTVGFGDFVIFAGAFGSSAGDSKYEVKYDLNQDGKVGFVDFLIFAENFGKEVPSAVVAIPDANLRAVLEKALGKASGAPINQAEMRTLRTIEARNSSNSPGIRDLAGLEHAANLTHLDLRFNTIENLAPLAGLTGLSYLDLTEVRPSLTQGAEKKSPLDLSPLSDLANLTRLVLNYNKISDLSPLSGLSGLNSLKLSAVHIIWDESNPPPRLDLSPLSGLASLTELILSFNNISDLSSLSGLTDLTYLGLQGNTISNLAPLSGLTNLRYLDLSQNAISDLSPLTGLTNLREVFLSINDISDLSPLSANLGLNSGDTVDVRENPLSDTSTSVHIAALRARGVSVSSDDVLVFSEPQIYNDNVFVLPVSDDLAAGNLPLTDYTARFFAYFNDEFDFLMFVPNVPNSELDPGQRYSRYIDVKNDVEGIGKGIFADSGRWSSAGKLQGVVNSGSNAIHPISERGRSIVFEGPTLHELMHRWANFIVRSHGVHWGFSSADGNMGGFDIADLVDHGNGRFSAGWFTLSGAAANVRPYGPIELYLAGFIPPEEVPDLWVAEDGKWLTDAEGESVRADDGDPIFSASRVTIYKIEDIIAEHGPRVPDHTKAQKDFRAAVILLVSERFPATQEILQTVSRDVAWFSHAEADLDDNTYNFHEATGGRGTIAMDGLPRFQRRAGSKIVVPNSFGIHPPPIVDHWDNGNRRKDAAGTLKHVPIEAERP